jgi:hypothetical protein
MKDSDLKKSLYQAVMKALGSKEGKQHAANHAVADLADNNMSAQMPESHLPASGSSTLHKDVSVSELHQQKQAQAEAKVGMRPGQSGAGMKKVNAATMMASEDKPERGIDRLRKFIEKCEMKKSQKGPAARGKTQAGNEITSRSPKSEDANPPIREYSDVKDGKLGRMHQESLAGVRVRQGKVAEAKKIHQKKLSQLRSESKPNLPKSEKLGKILKK